MLKNRKLLSALTIATLSGSAVAMQATSESAPQFPQFQPMPIGHEMPAFPKMDRASINAAIAKHREDMDKYFSQLRKQHGNTEAPAFIIDMQNAMEARRAQFLSDHPLPEFVVKAEKDREERQAKMQAEHKRIHTEIEARRVEMMERHQKFSAEMAAKDAAMLKAHLKRVAEIEANYAKRVKQTPDA